MGLREERKPILLLLLGVTLVIVAAFAFAEISLWLKPVSPAAAPLRIVVVPEGATAAEIAEILKSQGFIRNPALFRLLAQYRGMDDKIKTGEYEISQAMSPAEILERLVNGPIVTYPFTIREGLTVEQTADSLAAQGFANRELFLKAARDRSLVQGLIPADADLKEPLEGYLFPDTYRVGRGITEEEIVALMLARFREVLAPDLQERAKEIGMPVHDVITLASIIEKEAVVDDERAIISGVFHNRLKIGMKLDADPTVRYAIGKFTGPVTLADTKKPSPYNTYRQAGLPPGPIAAPGLASIRAALYPAETKCLYFVAKNDGTHFFSSTLRDHINAIKKYHPYGFR